MKKKRLHILRQMEVLMGQMAAECGTECSEAGFAAMKRIIKALRYMVYVCEEARINRLKELGRITLKEAVHLKAKNRRNYLSK